MSKQDLSRQLSAVVRQRAEITIRLALMDWAAHRGPVDRHCAQLYDVVQDPALPLMIRSDAAEELTARLT